MTDATKILFSLSAGRRHALDLAATHEVECPFCGQPAGRWCKVNQKEFLYTPSPHIARLFAWLELGFLAGEAEILLDALWTPSPTVAVPITGPGAEMLEDIL